MTRLEFMKELESLLLDIPLEEREEALRYYNGYFDDAGEDQEQEIISELGSPARVASIIKAELNPGAQEKEHKGYYTEKGYQESIKNEYEISKDVKSQADQADNHQANGFSGTYGNGTHTNNDTHTNNGTYTDKESTAQDAGRNNARYNYSQYNNTQGNDTRNNGSQGNNYQGRKDSNTAIIVIIAIFTLPVWLPILIAMIGILIGVTAAILGILFGLGAAGIAMIGAGIALFIGGLAQIAVPFYGLLYMGGGLIVLGLGMLLTMAFIVLCKNLLPAMIRGIVNLCRLPFRNRSVKA